MDRSRGGTHGLTSLLKPPLNSPPDILEKPYMFNCLWKLEMFCIIGARKRMGCRVNSYFILSNTPHQVNISVAIVVVVIFSPPQNLLTLCLKYFLRISSRPLGLVTLKAAPSSIHSIIESSSFSIIV